MRFISGLLSLPFLIVLIVFVIHNEAPIELDLWPFGLKIAMPVSLLSLAFLTLGFLLGSFLALPRLWRSAREKKGLKKEIVNLKKEIVKQTPPISAPSILMQGRYQTLTPNPENKKTGISWPWKRKKNS